VFRLSYLWSYWCLDIFIGKNEFALNSTLTAGLIDTHDWTIVIPKRHMHTGTNGTRLFLDNSEVRNPGTSAIKDILDPFLSFCFVIKCWRQIEQEPSL
jgi:hypothetical protein